MQHSSHCGWHEHNVLTNVLLKDILEKSVWVIASLSAESLYPLEELFVITLDDSQFQCKPIYRIDVSQCHAFHSWI